MSYADQRRAAFRMRATLADPSMPLLAFTGLLIAAAALWSPWLAWTGFAALAGYSLSGSA
jgi:hypothetical protein